MTDYRKRLAEVDWYALHPMDADALYTLTVTVCRATRGACFCGCHTTPLDDFGKKPQQEPGRRGDK